MGEETLQRLLEQAQQDQLIESFKVQPKLLAGGKSIRPDAIATLKNGRTLVMDSKAVDKQQQQRTTSTDTTIDTDTVRQDYTRNLKSKMTDLQKKGYPSLVSHSYPTVWMVLPHDRDVQRAYRNDNVVEDQYGIHSHAQTQKIQLMGPESFMSSLRTLNMIYEEEEQQSIQDSAAGGEALQPLLGQKLVDLVRHYRKLEAVHKKLIVEHNQYVTKLEDYYERGQEILDTQKLGKRQKPQGLISVKGLSELPPLAVVEVDDANDDNDETVK